MDQIDGFSGGLAEQPTDSDSLVGPTFSCIIANQFKRLMQGDRFFFAHPPEGDLNQRGLKLNSRRTVQSRSLSDIICDNTDVQRVPEKAMQPSPSMSCADAVPLDFDAIAADIIGQQPGECNVNLNILFPKLPGRPFGAFGLLAHFAAGCYMNMVYTYAYTIYLQNLTIESIRKYV